MSTSTLVRSRFCLGAVAAAFLLLVQPAHGASADGDALSLESGPAESAGASNAPKLFIEGAIGSAQSRVLPGSSDTGRLSLDLSYSGKLGTNWRLVFSDRIDVIHPTAAPGADATINSLREAYASWQPDGGSLSFDFGRINARSGPGYGYNPSDFFRDGSLRVVTTADPFALRQNRLGTVMLRAQRLWEGGSVSFAHAPKLESRPSADGWSADLGSTNNRARSLFTLSTKISEGINSQVLLYKDAGLSPTIGANASALLSDAAVAHVEWTRGREPDLLSRTFGGPVNLATRNRFVGGVTYTTLGKTSVTAEYQYNGFALSQSRWASLAATPGAQFLYLGESLRRLELAPRQALLMFVSQRSLWLKDLDLTAYVRFNLEDSSKLAWVELRHHWSNFDLTLQLQQNIGRPSTEFGLLPDRRVLQVLGTYYF
jgi:hypothetical protein